MTAPTPRAGVTVTDEVVDRVRRDFERRFGWDLSVDEIEFIRPLLVEQISAGIAEAIHREPIPFGASFISTADYMAGRAHAELIALSYGKEV